MKMYLRLGTVGMRTRFFVMVVLFSLNSVQSRAASESDAQSSVPKKCSELIRNYVKATRGWDAKNYVIEKEGFGESSLGFSVWLLEEYKEILPPGGSKSFHVDVDQACSKVVGELAYQ